MRTYPSDDGQVALVSLDRGEDLLEGLRLGVEEMGAEAAWIEVIGGLDRARIGWWDRDEQEYRPIEASHVEIAAGLGNVSSRDGRPFVHLHLVVSGPDGSALGGHALEGCTAFIVEARVRSFSGRPPVRLPAPQAPGLWTWPGR